MQTEILIGDNLYNQRAFQMPVMALDAKHPFLQAALDNGPISLSDCDDSANFYESEPEILLTDSDEEEIDEAEVETAAGSSDDQGQMSDEESMEGEVFDEFAPSSVCNANFNLQSMSDVAKKQEEKADKKPNTFTLVHPGQFKRVFLEDK